MFHLALEVLGFLILAVVFRPLILILFSVALCIGPAFLAFQTNHPVLGCLGILWALVSAAPTLEYILTGRL